MRERSLAAASRPLALAVLAAVSGCGPAPEPAPVTPSPVLPSEPRSAKADLVVRAMHLSTHAPEGREDTVSVCLNEAPPGQPRLFLRGQEAPDAAPDAGPDFLDVRNQGQSDAGPYRLRLGIQHVETGQQFGCGFGPRLRGTAASQTSRYAGPYCCSFPAHNLPLGAFRYLVQVDTDQEVPQDDRGVRALLSDDGFTQRP